MRATSEAASSRGEGIGASAAASAVFVGCGAGVRDVVRLVVGSGAEMRRVSALGWGLEGFGRAGEGECCVLWVRASLVVRRRSLGGRVREGEVARKGLVKMGSVIVGVGRLFVFDEGIFCVLEVGIKRELLGEKV